ncbi:MAG: hypothetical protein ACM31C_26465 [Acidobacteriota bacterium]
MTRWWWLVMLAACGDNAFYDAPKSGTRLRVEWFQAEDGSEVTTGNIYDRQRQEFCTIQAWSDGATRCTREAGYVGYLDAACTQRLVVAGVQGEVAFDFDQATCAQASAWVAGDVLAGTQWYEKGDTGCMGPYTTDQPLRVAEKEIDPNAFARLATSAPLGDGRIRTIDYTSADGFRLVKGYEDSELATPCYPGFEDCALLGEYEIDYTDAACTQPIVGLHHDTCNPPATYAIVPDPACSNLQHYHRIGAIVGIRSAIFQRTGDTCTMTTPSTDVEYRALGDEVEVAHLAVASESAPGRRLQPMFFTGDGVAAPTGQLMDTQVGVPCTWQPATDGATRCLPFSASWYTLYTDPSCTQGVPIATWTSAACSDGAPQPQYAAEYFGAGNEIRPLLGRHAGTLYQRNGQTCAPTTIPGTDFFDVDPRTVDPRSFEMAERVLEP